MKPLQPFLEQLTSMHDHLCPRQVLGVRIGLYAADLLGLDLPQTDKRVYAFVETDGCFSDGVSVASGCWLGHRTMRLIDHGKVAATFVDSETGKAFRIWPSPLARERAAEYTPELGHWRAQLENYQHMPNDELLSASAVELTLSLSEIISRPGLRVNCSICGEEIVNEREVLRNGEPVCSGCAGNNYWRKAEDQPLRTIVREPHTI
ncbi:MAG: formylmethanofuran dehydrogenase [Chloroflexi bacterium]|nr:formylmethanofuran dehydrogenase [Chloroflexota bacterium]